MASKAKQDITGETALNAVEEALSVDFKTDAEDINAIEAKIEDAASEVKNTVLEETTVEESDPAPESLSSLSEIEALPPESPPAAANDEINPELATLLYSIQQKPRSKVFLFTFLISALWLGACAYYGYQNILPTISENFVPADFFKSQQLMIFAAIALLPLLPLWAFAMLIRRSQEMRHAANSMTEAAIQLLQPENTASNSVATVGRAIRREVNAIGDGVERAIARAGELEFMVQKEVMNLERSYGDSEVRLRRLVDEIGTERDTMVHHADQLKTAISSTHSNLTADIEVVSGKIEETLRNATMSMSDTLEMRGDTVSSKLSETSEGLINLLANTGDILNAKITAAKEDLEINVNQTTETMTNTITTNGKAVARLLETRTAGLQQATELIDQKLETGKKEFEESFSNNTGELSRVMEAAGKSVNSLLKSTASELAEQSNDTIQKIEQGRTEFRKEMSEKTVEFSNMIASGNSSIKEVMSASAADIAEQNLSTIQKFEESRIALNKELAGQSDEIVQTLSDIGDNIVGKLETSTDNFEKTGDQITQQISDNLSIRASEFANQVSEAGNTINSTLDSKLGAIDESLTTSGNNLVSALGMRTEALGKVLEERTETIGQTIGDKLSGFGKLLTEQVDDTVTKLQNQTDLLQENTKSVEQVITGKTKQVEDAVRSSTINFAATADENLKAATEKSDEINQTLKETTDKIAEKMAITTQELNTALDDQTGKFSKIVDDNTETFSKAIEERTNNLSSKLSQGAHQIATALDEKSIAAAERMEASVKALDTRLSENANTVENQFAAGNQILEENLAKGKDELLGTISQTLTQVSSEIDGKAEKISDLLTDRANIINEQLGSSLVETQRNLETKTSELNELLTTRTSELSGLLDTEAKPIVTSIIEAGTQTGEKLASLSKMIGEEANALFSNIGQSSTLLDGLIKDASSNLDMMQNSLSGQIENFSNTVELSKNNIAQSEIIASDLNEKMQSTSNEMLIGVGGIAQRFEAQSIILQDATRMIDAAQSNLEVTLDSKQDALQQLAVGLVSHSDQINSSMSSFSSMINTMIEEASSKSRNISGDISAEISKAIEDSTSRFEDAVTAMRSAAHTMRTELEDTRAQMRKGILELPDETEKNASAMRRVVSDQIAALRDLSAIVEKSGKYLDATPATTTGQRTHVASAQPAPAVTRAPAQPSPSVDMALRGSQPAVSPTPSTAPRTSTKSSGWVSDLLRRASEEERAPAVNVSDNRSPNQVVESLNSLSVDIANAIDHETSVELWDRYQRGETNVFTRRLYTLQGQQTFDEIRNKYTRDSNFKNAVDRYISDFEQLLGKETSNGQNQALAQSYLTSDTGKVYTMLAHAAGRLGS